MSQSEKADFVSISNPLNSQTRHLSTNCTSSSLLAPEWKVSKSWGLSNILNILEKREDLPISLPLEQKGISLELLEVSQRQRMRKLRLSQNSSSAVSTISLGLMKQSQLLYLSICPNLISTHNSWNQRFSWFSCQFNVFLLKRLHNIQEMEEITLQWKFVAKRNFFKIYPFGSFSFISPFSLARFSPRHHACRRTAQTQSHGTCQNHAPWKSEVLSIQYVWKQTILGRSETGPLSTLGK